MTVEIPDPLYKEVKIRAVEDGLTLREFVLHALRDSLHGPGRTASFLERRKLLPEYEKALKTGALSAGTDSTGILSEDRFSL
jgi:hypothetical protein